MSTCDYLKTADAVLSARLALCPAGLDPPAGGFVRESFVLPLVALPVTAKVSEKIRVSHKSVTATRRTTIFGGIIVLTLVRSLAAGRLEAALRRGSPAEQPPPATLVFPAAAFIA